MKQLPPGFTIDAPAKAAAAQGAAGLPPGFTIDQPAAQPPAQDMAAEQPSWIQRELSGAARSAARAGRSIAVGALGGLGDLAQAATIPIAYPVATGLSALGVEGADDVFLDQYGRPASSDLRQNIDHYTNNYAAPQNKLERVTDSATEFLAGMLTGSSEAKILGEGVKGAKVFGQVTDDMIRNAMQKAGPKTANDLLGAAGAGAASQVVSEETDNPIAAFLASIVGGTAASGGAAVAKNAYKVGRHPVQSLKQGVRAVGKTIMNAGDGGLTGTPGVSKSGVSNFAEEGRELENLTGIKFDVAQLTGNKRALLAKDYAKNSIASADKIFNNEQQQIGQAEGFFKKTLDNISPESTGKLTTGQRTMDAYDEATNTLRENATLQGRQEFKHVDELSGGGASITPSNFARVLERFAADKDGKTLTSKHQRKFGKTARDYLDQLTQIDETPIMDPGDVYGAFPAKQIGVEKKSSLKNLTASEMQAVLQDFTDEAMGSGSIFGDTATAASRRFANAAKEALLLDLDYAAKNSSNPEAAMALTKARDNYRGNMQKLKDVENTMLGKYLSNPADKTAERVAMRFKDMQPSELDDTLSFLDTHDKGAAQNARRFILEDALEEARRGKGQVGEGLEELTSYSPRQFLSNLPDNEKLQTAFKNDPKTLNEINALSRSLNRISVLGTGMGNSATYTRSQIDQLAQDGTSINGIGRAIIRVLTPREMADMIIDPALRGQLLTATGKNMEGPLADRIMANIYRKVAAPAARSTGKEFQKPEEEQKKQ